MKSLDEILNTIDKTIPKPPVDRENLEISIEDLNHIELALTGFVSMFPSGTEYNKYLRIKIRRIIELRKLEQPKIEEKIE